MFRKVLALALFAKVAVAAVTSLAVEGFPNVSLTGSTDGTGAAGTTYILKGVDTIGTVLETFTMTLVEDSSELLETVDLPSATLVAFAQCTISGPLAECEEIAEEGTAMTTTAVETISIASIQNSVSLAGSNATGSSSSSTSKGSSNSSTSHASSTASGASSSSLSSLSSIPTTTSPATVGPAPVPAPAPTIGGSGHNFEAMGWFARLAIAGMCIFIGAL
ncbi:hypothetical protein SCHPADRAFT_905900 [Schizopora paradoxa]|uniref:GPI anchored protein n=1 Tax=Schizopora paradoxa TaxID=27342 RepID=A0A0H2RIU4_9AGAM|nr:hypothetical protein SCHPADRAFT_905900 [Schizopora paradoxa]